MGQLRDRMEQDLKLKRVSPATIRNYLLYCRKFAARSNSASYPRRGSRVASVKNPRAASPRYPIRPTQLRIRSLNSCLRWRPAEG
jgi:hypothetical protein